MKNTVIVDGITYIRHHEASEESIIRCRDAGVHIGKLESREGQEVRLSNARRLWKWAGAFTLNAVATRGVTRSESRISLPVSEILLLDAIEVIPVSQGVDLSTTEDV